MAIAASTISANRIVYAEGSWNRFFPFGALGRLRGLVAHARPPIRGWLGRRLSIARVGGGGSTASMVGTLNPTNPYSTSRIGLRMLKKQKGR